MTKIIPFLFLGVLLIAATVTVRARTHHWHRPAPTPAPAPVPVPQSPSLLGFNYGHAGETTFNAPGVARVRFLYYGFNDPNIEALALSAKAQGAYVIIGGGGDFDSITPSDLGNYDAQAILQAKWCQQNHIDQCSIGNEGEYRLSGMSIAQWQNHLANVLAPQVKAVYSGVVSYETSSDFEQNWITNGRGSIDILGWNAYCGYGCNAPRLQQAINAFGQSHTYISETNADMGTGQYDTDATHAAEVKSDAVKLLSFGVPVYYFTYDACNNTAGVADDWGLFTCGALTEPLTAAALPL